jgi:hypothetical protein
LTSTANCLSSAIERLAKKGRSCLDHENPHIKALLRPENAVKFRICIAASVYMLIAIDRNRFHPELSLQTSLQILSVTVFEKMRLEQALIDIH